MGSLVLQMGWWVLVVCVSYVQAIVSIEGSVFIDGKMPIANTDDDFICATLDWWPPEKCDYGTCSWGHASLLNLDLKNTVFLNAVKAFSPLKIRLGGTLQDKVIYETEDESQPCIPFAKNSSIMFGFTNGCLPLSRWDELNSFFNESGALVVFGLNALRGKSIQSGTAVGPWDYTNAASLIRYTVKKGYKIYGWELGNELSGRGIGVGISADQYASDTVALHDLVEEIYKEVDIRPQIIAPGGFFDAGWFQQFLAKTVGSVDVITHHIYNLGPGSDEHLVDRILNPSVLESGGDVFRNLHNVVRTSPNSAAAWVGEAGGAYNSGHDGVTNAFVFSFWYLDQLGRSSTYDTKTYCRQTLIGGNYGLLNTTTFIPNPDYYSALLWHRLMGRQVLSTTFNGTKTIRAYAHCAKHSQGITLLLINIDGNTTVRAKVDFNGTLNHHHHHKHRHHRSRGNLLRHRKQMSEAVREEYHLTPMGGNIRSRTVMLNGKALSVDSSGTIPSLQPVRVNSSELITVAPYSIVFVGMPNVSIPACM
ncbi:heparanase-like protein 3 isoform X1 [Salvia miltiorrhiza]|uniref:heparanase-like protein 3 isoform X1 n=1 Tax=Salvia miltiorrhiza TaxID=226208 RepID=UPI0025AC5951|nr:heparanase-like protein 3 isoform X1 [Salvia miltiorrhiza]